MPTYTIPLSIISLEGNGFHLLAEIKIFNTLLMAVVDTGASRTVIHKPILEKFTTTSIEESNIQANTIFSTSETILATIPKFQIGKFKLLNYDAVGIDLSSVTETYAQLGHPEIGAIIGGDILNNYRAKIDYSKSHLKLHK